MITLQRYYAALRLSAFRDSTQRDLHSVMIYNHATAKIERTVHTPADCGGAFDLSSDGQFLATGYWRREGVDIWRICDTAVVETFGPSQVSGVVFDRTSTKLIVRSERGTFIYSTNSPYDATRIPNAGSIHQGCFAQNTNHFLVPSRRSGTILRVDLDTSMITTISVPTKRTVHCIKPSPSDCSVFILDTAQTIWCLGPSLEMLLWKTTIKPIPLQSGIYVGAYSGDGSLIGLTLTNYDGFDTIVLDARTGEQMYRIPDTSCEGNPFDSDSVLLGSGRLLNLQSKKVSKGISRIVD